MGGIHVNPWLIHVNVRQKPLQCCKVINLQLIKINGKKLNKWDLINVKSICTENYTTNDRKRQSSEWKKF